MGFLKWKCHLLKIKIGKLWPFRNTQSATQDRYIKEIFISIYMETINKIIFKQFVDKIKFNFFFKKKEVHTMLKESECKLAV